MQDQVLTAAAQAAIAKVEKLLNLARNAGANESEAQNALDMAHKILEQHNLDMALVERRIGDSASPHAKREDKSTGGGLYKWQRELWKRTAELNFCVYFSVKGLAKGSKYENRLVGNPVNVLATRIMAEYLQDTVEKMAAQWAKDEGYHSRFVSEAIQYREGMASRISERLGDLQWERLQAANREKQEREAAARHPAAASSGTSLVLTDIKQSEEDLNEDHLNNLEPGTTAQRRLEYQSQRAIADHRRQAWKTEGRDGFEKMFEHLGPEVLAQLIKLMMRQDKQNEDYQAYLRGEATETYGPGYKPSKSRAVKERVYRETAEDRRKDSYAYRAGERAGDEVGLDRQIDHNKQGLLK